MQINQIILKGFQTKTETTTYFVTYLYILCLFIQNIYGRYHQIINIPHGVIVLKTINC